jgi:hypothetical protein
VFAIGSNTLPKLMLTPLPENAFELTKVCIYNNFEDIMIALHAALGGGAANYMAPINAAAGNAHRVEVARAVVLPTTWAHDLIAMDPLMGVEFLDQVLLPWIALDLHHLDDAILMEHQDVWHWWAVFFTLMEAKAKSQTLADMALMTTMPIWRML